MFVYTTCSYVPVEIIYAAGLIPSRLIPPAGEETGLLPRSYCSYARACAAAKLTAPVIFTACCDGLRRCYDVRKAQGGRVFILDLPRQDDESGVGYYREELLRLAEWLEAAGGRPIPEGALREAIKIYGGIRAKLKAVAGATGMSRKFFDLLFAVLTCAPEETRQLLDSFQAGSVLSGSGQKDRRVLLAGTFLPERGILALLEESDAAAVFADFCCGERFHVQYGARDYPCGGDPWLVLARAYLGKPPCPRMTGKNERSLYIQTILERTLPAGDLLRDEILRSWALRGALVAFFVQSAANSLPAPGRRVFRRHFRSAAHPHPGFSGDDLSILIFLLPRRFSAVNIKEYIYRKTQNGEWHRYVTSPRTYLFLELLSGLWCLGKLNRHSKASLLFGTRLLRQAYQGARPVVWTNVYTPPELIWAWGGIPFMPEAAAAVAANLGWSTYFLKVAEGAWYSTDLCSFHRCALGMAMERLLPRPDLILASSHLCDGAVKFLEAAGRLYGCPYFLLPVPYRDTPQARSWLAGEIRALQRKLKTLLPARPKEAARVFANVNATRRHMVAVNELRKNVPAPWRGSEALTLVILFLNGLGTAEALSFYRELERVLSRRVRKKTPVVPEQKRRLLWLHFKPFYANPLLDLLEIGHQSVIAFEEVSYVFWEEIPPDAYAEGIAAKMLANPLWGPGEKRVNLVLRLVRDYHAQGVIHFSHWGCRQSTGAAALLRAALNKEGIPFLDLDGDCIDPRNFMEGQTVTRVESFLEMV